MTISCELKDAAATELLGEAVARLLVPRDVVLLVGELGAGKTTLARGLVRGLGGADMVTSPTFTLRHEYETTPALTHVDCWRLVEADEFDDLGLDEVIAGGGALVIEWGEFADFRFGESALHLSLSDADGGESRLARLDLRSAVWSLRSDRLLLELAGGTGGRDRRNGEPVITLAIESSSTQLAVAVVADDVAPSAFETPGARRHTELLGPAIALVLEAAGVAVSVLDGIVVDVGPGLFTGLRTGVASAKGLALGAGLPIVGVRSTAALRRAASQFPGAVAAALDVRRGEVAYEFPGDECARIGGLDELLGGLDRLVEEGRVLLVGNGWRFAGEVLLARYGANVSFAGAEFDTPSAVVVGRAGLEELHAGHVSSAIALEVDYLREADVAINWSTRISSGA